MNSKKLTNLFIVGAAKSGTTSLFDLLSKSNEIKPSLIKEPNFFSSDLVKKIPDTYLKKYPYLDSTGNIIKRHKAFVKKKVEYEKLWDCPLKAKYLLDGSVSYLFSKSAPTKILEYNSEAKVIIILRDPIERMISHILTDKSRGRYNLKIENNYMPKNDIVWDVNMCYLELSLYYEQVLRYLKIFPKENLLILDFNELNSLENLSFKISKFLKLKIVFDKNINSNKTLIFRHSLFSKFIFLYKFFKISKILPKELFNNLIYKKPNQLRKKELRDKVFNKIEYLIPFIEADKKKLVNILPSKQFKWLINESP